MDVDNGYEKAQGGERERVAWRNKLKPVRRNCVAKEMESSRQEHKSPSAEYGDGMGQRRRCESSRTNISMGWSEASAIIGSALAGG